MNCECTILSFYLSIHQFNRSYLKFCHKNTEHLTLTTIWLAHIWFAMFFITDGLTYLPPPLHKTSKFLVVVVCRHKCYRSSTRVCLVAAIPPILTPTQQIYSGNVLTRRGIAAQWWGSCCINTQRLLIMRCGKAHHKQSSQVTLHRFSGSST